MDEKDVLEQLTALVVNHSAMLDIIREFIEDLDDRVTALEADDE